MRGAAHQAGVDAVAPLRIGAEQGAAGQQVDAPRHATAEAMQGLEGIVAQRQLAVQAGHGQPVGQVGRGLRRVQRTQVVARDDALRELLQARFGEALAQLGLADQHDLQQLVRVGLQIRQQAQLFEHLAAEVLRLVDDQQAVPSGRMPGQQEGVERVHASLQAVLGGARQPEFLQHRVQQLGGAELGVEDVGHVAVGRQLGQEAAAHGGLAGADLAGQQHEATAALDPVEQVRQCLAMALAQEQETGVRRDAEGVLRQTEGRPIHGARG